MVQATADDGVNILLCARIQMSRLEAVQMEKPACKTPEIKQLKTVVVSDMARSRLGVEVVGLQDTDPPVSCSDKKRP